MQVDILSMTRPEMLYCYSQSQQISMQTGLIGYLRGGLDRNSKSFHSDFIEFRTELKTQEFMEEFIELTNELRYGENAVLKDHDTLAECCRIHPESCITESQRDYGFRVNTKEYAYMIRLNPIQGEYNLHCYCYQRKWLDCHMKHAEKGIRFIDPHYKELFTIPDGECIRIQLQGGGHVDNLCRYIDETHVEIGNNLYHICQFAERMEHGNNKVIPYRSSLPEKCFSLLPSTGKIIEIQKGVDGYRHTNMVSPIKSNREIVDLINKGAGVTRAQEEAMLAGSMFGWQVPAADPKNYDEHGVPISPKQKARSKER